MSERDAVEAAMAAAGLAPAKRAEQGKRLKQLGDEIEKLEARWLELSTHLTGERQMHYANFGPFEDVVTAFERGYVLDGTRFDHYRKFLLGSDGRPTRATEHLVYIQNHDQVARPRRSFSSRTSPTPT